MYFNYIVYLCNNCLSRLMDIFKHKQNYVDGEQFSADEIFPMLCLGKAKVLPWL